MRTNQKAVTCQQHDSWSVYGKRHRRSGGPCPGQDLHRHRAWNYSLSVSNEHSAWNHQHDHMTHLNCPNWSKPFSLREDVYKQRKAMSKRKLLFCSPACAGKSRRAPPRAAECAFCAKRFWIAGRFVTFRSKEKKRKEKEKTCKLTWVGTRTYLRITHKTKGIAAHTP